MLTWCLLRARAHDDFVNTVQIFLRVVFDLDLPAFFGFFENANPRSQYSLHFLDRSFDIRVDLDFVDVFRVADADAALAASLFHYAELAIGDLRDALAAQGIVVRRDTVTV